MKLYDFRPEIPCQYIRVSTDRRTCDILSPYITDRILAIYPPSQKTTGSPVDECSNDSTIGVEAMDYATARCHTQADADSRVEAEGEDG